MWSLVQRRRLQKQAISQSNGTLSEKGNTTESVPSAARDAEQQGTAPGSQEPKHEENGRVYLKTADDDDPFDPRNWPLLDRAKNIAILAYLIFVQAWAGAAESMANSAASTDQRHSQVAENLAISIFGGRIVCRFLVGLCASATLTINGSSVKDQFRPVKRAFVFPVIAWANVTAPVIAPIASGWIVENNNLRWHWVDWISLIISGPAFILALLFLPETYLPVLLDWKAAALRRATNDERSCVSEYASSKSFKARLRKGLTMPAKFFFTEPVIAVLGTYLILLYTLLFTFLSGFDYLFKATYGLSTGMTGACFGAIASGATAFALLAPGFYSWARSTTEHVRGASVEPEFRLWPAIVAGPLLPVSLFWLGWGNYRSIPIWSSLAACFLFGAVMIAIYVSSYEYIIDSYGDHSAMALSSITFLRYMIAGGMVMASRPMYSGIGVHWTMTLLGSIAVVLAPAPLIFWRLGPKLRKTSPYAKSPDD
ncbi:MFS general substrate transporter [Parathielavia hyrcaniae]|uniref:MFS general substrate transporter n=1 Tax=Parathielavia hyrcaniae TaxID=113614 RepID=A0AAN6SXM7_9PEZI|nr:MFS general substrate transporter [Parathielavia hyrcaniae]